MFQLTQKCLSAAMVLVEWGPGEGELPQFGTVFNPIKPTDETLSDGRLLTIRASQK